MVFIAENGVEVTDEMIEEWAKAYEAGDFPGRGREITVGRPRLSSEELVAVTFKMPKSHLEKLDDAAKKRGETRSEFLRSTVDGVLEYV